MHDAGLSIGLDVLSRDLLRSGAFAALVTGCAVTGATSCGRRPTCCARSRLAITADLERDGVRALCDSYQRLLDRIATKAQTAHPPSTAAT